MATKGVSVSTDDIASALKALGSSVDAKLLSTVGNGIASMIKSDNKEFKRKRFLKAAGLKPTKG